MPLKLIRVDDRLIHGQVVESWLPHLGIDRIIVVSDSISGDETRKNIMRFSAPEDVSVEFADVEKASGRFREFEESGDNFLMLVPGLEEIVALLESGIRMNVLNIGGMHYSAGRTQSIGRAIFLSETDAANLKTISSYGVKIEGKGVPTDPPVDLDSATK